jgi:hypothetical protein
MIAMCSPLSMTAFKATRHRSMCLYLLYALPLNLTSFKNHFGGISCMLSSLQSITFSKGSQVPFMCEKREDLKHPSTQFIVYVPNAIMVYKLPSFGPRPHNSPLLSLSPLKKKAQKELRVSVDRLRNCRPFSVCPRVSVASHFHVCFQRHKSLPNMVMTVLALSQLYRFFRRPENLPYGMCRTTSRF